MMKTLYIYGSGSTGCEIVDIVRRINSNDMKWNKVLFIDDFREEQEWYGIPVLNFEAMLCDNSDYECVIALGEPKHRKKLYQDIKGRNIKLATIIDPGAVVSTTAIFGEGVIVFPFTFISCNTRIDDNVMLEIGVIIGHDIFIGKHSVISSTSVLGGRVSVGECGFIGLNSTVREDVKIGSSCVVSMGSSVFHNVEDHLVVMGNPARPILKNENGIIFKNKQ